MSTPQQSEAPAGRSSTRLPPRWIIRSIWRGHRAAYRWSGGRWGLRRPTRGKAAGMLRLRTRGRRSGVERAVILCYFEDGARLVTLAMNGWDEHDPAWWLNLVANPEAEVDLLDGTRPVRARAATPEEHQRLWPVFPEFPGWGDVEALSAVRGRETTVVVLEPR